VLKQGLEERQAIKSYVIIEIFTKTTSETIFLTVHRESGQIIDVVRRKSWLLSV